MANLNSTVKRKEPEREAQKRGKGRDAKINPLDLVNASLKSLKI